MIFRKNNSTDILFEIFKRFLIILDSIFPKNDNILLFPIKNKNDYKDNLRFLYESALKRSQFNCILLCYSNELWDAKNLVSFHSFKGLLFWLNARFIFIHHGTKDIPYAESIDFRRRKLINLWHGIPLKGIGLTDTKSDVVKLKKEFKLYTSIISSSKLDQLAMQASFGLPKERVWITGLPRNDVLIKKNRDLPEDLLDEKKWLQEKLANQKMVLYMPTWRGSNKHPKFTKEECLRLNKILKANNHSLVVKNHPNAPPLIFEDLEVIDISSSPCKEVSILLRQADILITDYSSVWVDYLLLSRPIVSYCYDLESYIKDPGFIYNYELVFPEKINITFESFLSDLKRALSGKINNRQNKLKHIFHDNINGQNSERICDIVQILRGN